MPPRRRRWLRRLAAALFIVALLPVVAAIALIATFDANAYRPRLVEAVKQATGLDLAIAGKIGIRWALVPTLVVEDAKLSNPPGFSRPEMVSLYRLELRLAPWPLLDRRIEVDELLLTDPDILLETNAAGQSNWQFQPPALPTRPGKVTAGPAAKAAALPAIVVRRIEIVGGRLAYRDGAGVARGVGLRRLTLLAASPAAPILVDATVDVAGTPVGLTATGLPLAATLGGAPAPLPVVLSMTVQGATASLRGAVARLSDLPTAELALDASIPDLAALSMLAGTKLPSLRDVVVQSDIARTPTGIALRGLRLSSLQVDLHGDVTLSRAPRLTVQGRLQAARIDGDGLGKVFSAPAAAPIAAPVAADPPPGAPAQPGQGKIFSEAELPFGLLQSVDADVVLAVDRWLQGGVTYTAIAGHALLQGGKLRLDPFAATLPGGPMQLTVTLDASQTQPPVGLSIQAPAIALQPLLAMLNLPQFAHGLAALTADLHGAGRSPHAIASGLAGSFAITAESAQIDPGLLGALLRQRELAKLAGGLTALRCLAIRAEAQDGIFDLRTLLIDTAPLRVSGTGTVDLGAETLALRLLTTARLGGAGLFAPVDVGGALRAPIVTVGKMDAAASGKGSPPFGLVIGRLGLDRLVAGASGNGGPSCEQALAIARGLPLPAAPAEPAPGAKPPKPTDLLPKPADLLRQLLR